MTGFLNSPIANSCAPDANPAAAPSRVTVNKTNPPPPEIKSIHATCKISSCYALKVVKYHTEQFLFYVDDERDKHRANNGAVLTLADAEALADSINAFVRQERMKRAKREAGVV